MVAYFSGSTFGQTIENAIEETGKLVFCKELSDELDIHKYMKQNITKFEGVENLIIDTSVCTNLDDEIVAALEMVRTMYDSMRIIVFAPYKEAGDDFLTKCFNMGILNIINCDDFCEIREEFLLCLNTGKTYRDAVKYKEAKREKIVIKHEVKRAVNKRMVGFAGTEENIGVTHNAIILANFFRKQGYRIALVEMNDTGAFSAIAADFGERIFNEEYFTLSGVDYYPECREEKIVEILARSYNLVIFDLGEYEKCNRVVFERCEDRVIISGSKPWELGKLDKVFELATDEALPEYIFCFNFTQKKDWDAIREGMGELKNVYFMEYAEDPFSNSDFSGAEEIFKECLPEQTAEKKKGFVGQLMEKVKPKGKAKQAEVAK